MSVVIGGKILQKGLGGSVQILCHLRKTIHNTSPADSWSPVSPMEDCPVTLDNKELASLHINFFPKEFGDSEYGVNGWTQHSPILMSCSNDQIDWECTEVSSNIAL